MLKAYTNSKLQNVIDFVAKFGPSSCLVQKSTGVSAMALLAQIAVETGWGVKILLVFDNQGNRIDSKNLFNIKVSDSWIGKSGWAVVPEFINRQWIQSKQFFRVYDTYEESMSDYLNLISSLTRYADAWIDRGNPYKYIQEIAADGYATGPDYANTICSIMDNLIVVYDDGHGPE